MSTNENDRMAGQITEKIMTTPQSPPPFCISCKHYVPGPDGNDGSDKSKEPPTCKLAKFMDLVTGNTFQGYCVDFRREGMPCGFSGKLFEAK